MRKTNKHLFFRLGIAKGTLVTTHFIWKLCTHRKKFLLCLRLSIYSIKLVINFGKRRRKKIMKSTLWRAPWPWASRKFLICIYFRGEEEFFCAFVSLYFSATFYSIIKKFSYVTSKQVLSYFSSDYHIKFPPCLGFFWSIRFRLINTGTR